MKVTYTGRQVDLSPAQSEKLTAEFEKVSRILDNGRGEAEAHVVLSHERYQNNVEITVPYHHHELVGQGSDPDLFSAIHAAVGKLEKQAIRVREKWRESKRVPRKGTDVSTSPESLTEPLTETTGPAVASKRREGNQEDGNDKG